jgi:hypothetical protein
VGLEKVRGLAEEARVRTVDRLASDLKDLAKDLGSFRKLCMAEGAIRLVADRKKLITPVAFARALGLYSGGSHMAQILCALTDEDFTKRRPVRSSVIVNSKTLRPASRYFNYLRQKHKVEIPEHPAAEEAYWLSQLDALGYPDVDSVQVLGVDDEPEVEEPEA